LIALIIGNAEETVTSLVTSSPPNEHATCQRLTLAVVEVLAAVWLRGRSAGKVCPSSTPEDVNLRLPGAIMENALRDGNWSREDQVRKNGEYFTTNTIPLAYLADEPNGLCLTTKDISDENPVSM